MLRAHQPRPICSTGHDVVEERKTDRGQPHGGDHTHDHAFDGQPLPALIQAHRRQREDHGSGEYGGTQKNEPGGPVSDGKSIPAKRTSAARYTAMIASTNSMRREHDHFLVDSGQPGELRKNRSAALSKPVRQYYDSDPEPAVDRTYSLTPYAIGSPRPIAKYVIPLLFNIAGS